MTPDTRDASLSSAPGRVAYHVPPSPRQRPLVQPIAVVRWLSSATGRSANQRAGRAGCRSIDLADDGDVDDGDADVMAVQPVASAF